MLRKFNATLQCNEKGVFISLPSDQAPNLLLSLLETRPDLNSSEEGESLTDVPISPWATHANEVGLLLSAEPVCMTWKKNKQVPSLQRDTKRGINPMIDSRRAGCACFYFLTLSHSK